jgi:hypothetical protein
MIDDAVIGVKLEGTNFVEKIPKTLTGMRKIDFSKTVK